MAYIGTKPTIGNFQICDAISVVNGQAAYTMQVGSVNVLPETANHMIVSLNGVIQKPGSSFTVSGSTITFASNLATGDVINFIYILGSVLDLGVPSDATVTNAKLAQDIISGETDIGGAIADADLFLVDDGAGGTLRKTAASRIKTYIGAGDNTPAFMIKASASQTIANSTTTLISTWSEDLDTDSAWDTSSHRFTPQESGKYLIHITSQFSSGDDWDISGVFIRVNGGEQGRAMARNEYYLTQSVTKIFTLNGSSDYIDFAVRHESGSNKDITNDGANRFAWGIKLIGL